LGTDSARSATQFMICSSVTGVIRGRRRRAQLDGIFPAELPV